MNTWNQPYTKQFWIGMGLYSIAIFLYAFSFGGEWFSSTVVQFLIALLPTLPMLMVIRATLKNVRTLDELEQRIQLEAVLMTALLTGTITFGYGLLEFVGLVPDIPFWLVLPMMFTLWGVANGVVRRRY